MTTDPNDFLLSGGIPSAKFPTIGTLHKGTITASEVTQQTDIDGQPKTFKDGNPMMQLVITLQTDERDPEIDSDTGLRKLYVKGQMKAAIADAVRGQGRLEIGGTLGVKYVSDKASETRGYNPAKQYVAQYAPPAATAANDLLGVGQTTPQEPALAAAGGVPANDLL